MMDEIATHQRLSRSINSIIKESKFIAVTPDYDDFTKVHIKQNQLISADNRKVTINVKPQFQINK